MFLDDVAVTKDGAVTDQTSFESDFGGFEAGPPPPGSEDGTQKAWQRTPSLNYVAGPGVATDDTLAYGFGFEGIGDAATRATVMGDAMRYLGVLAGGGPVRPRRRRRRRRRRWRRRRSRQADTKAPQTKITGAPKKKTAGTDAKFKFKSDEAGSSFECKLDREPWKDCDSPQKYSGLEPGKHRFRVRATDKAGNRDKSPAKYRWRVEREA